MDGELVTLKTKGFGAAGVRGGLMGGGGGAHTKNTPGGHSTFPVKKAWLFYVGRFSETHPTFRVFFCVRGKKKGGIFFKNRPTIFGPGGLWGGGGVWSQRDQPFIFS